MLLKVLFLSLIFFNLSANTTLKEHYYVPTDEIRLSSIIPNVKEDLKLYSITQGRYTRRVKSKELISTLNKHGYTDYVSKSSYIKFTKQSPVNTSKIEQALKKIYSNKYKKIIIHRVEVNPRGFLKSMPKDYTIKLQSKSHLNKKGTLSIKANNKQIFFDYNIDATVTIYKARVNIKRNIELSHLNVAKKSIILDKFRAMPIQKVDKAGLQSKHNIKKDTVLTTRDTQALHLVKRGSNISVVLNSQNMAISFSAQALENGVYGDTIKVKKTNDKVIKIKVIGRNRGEVL